MDTAWWTLATALSSSFLTGCAALGVVVVQQRWKNKADEKAALEATVAALLTRSMEICYQTRAVTSTQTLRSGISEGINVLLGIRKPLDPMEFYDWMIQSLGPLTDAWSRTWLLGDKTLIQLANDLMETVNEVIAVSSRTHVPRTLAGQVVRVVVGEKTDSKIQDASDAALARLTEARRALTEYARTTLKMPETNLFAARERV
ncbi:MAG: hypothetical protein QG608_3081 [Actinomycetota bacterium]|nr:hypothetical protein [Actinomycetota bacterium]